MLGKPNPKTRPFTTRESVLWGKLVDWAKHNFESSNAKGKGEEKSDEASPIDEEMRDESNQSKKWRKRKTPSNDKAKERGLPTKKKGKIADGSSVSTSFGDFRDLLRPFIRFIRFAEMPAHFFATRVTPLGILSEPMTIAIFHAQSGAKVPPDVAKKLKFDFNANKRGFVHSFSRCEHWKNPFKSDKELSQRLGYLGSVACDDKRARSSFFRHII